MSEQVQEYNVACSFDFSVLDKGKHFTDCTIKVGEESFRSYRVLLAGCSKVLATKFIESDSTTLDLPDFDAGSFKMFIEFVYSGTLFLSIKTVPGVIRIAHDLDIKTLFDICSQFVDQVTSARTILHLLQHLTFALKKLPNVLKFAAALIEKLSNDTDFSYMPSEEFKMLVARARFTSSYARDDIIRKYMAATNTDSCQFDDFTDPLAGGECDTIQRTAYSAIFICSPPDQGLLRAMRSQINVCASGMLNGRDPTTLLDDEPAKHWFTESDGNAWVLFEFTELYIQPTDYAIWSHSGASTLRNWALQASNDRMNWVVLSTHRNDESIRMPFSTYTWPINTNGFFKYFRIIQTGNNWSGNRWLYMMKVEIWGVACSMDDK